MESNSEKNDTALAFLVPPEFDQIDIIRSENDKSFTKWPAHCNLFFPFPKSKVKEAVEILHSLQSFDVVLSSFYHTPNSKYMELRVDGKALVDDKGVKGGKKAKDKKKSPVLLGCKELHDLCDLIASKLNMEKKKPSFIPHITVGQCEQEKIDEKLKDLQKEWKVIEFKVTELVILEKKNERFKATHKISLN